MSGKRARNKLQEKLDAADNPQPKKKDKKETGPDKSGNKGKEPETGKGEEKTQGRERPRGSTSKTVDPKNSNIGDFVTSAGSTHKSTTASDFLNSLGQPPPPPPTQTELEEGELPAGDTPAGPNPQ